MTITVYGTPVSQGNHRASRSGHIYETTHGHKPWRDSVIWAARAWGMRVVGPVVVEMVFTFARPKSAAKRTHHAVKPDLSKLVRATEDALTIAGVWEDDARVVRCTAVKLYVGQPGALDMPGAVIEVTAA